jgi:hypothetical protein
MFRQEITMNHRVASTRSTVLGLTLLGLVTIGGCVTESPRKDCYAALRWTVANADKLGIGKQHIAVGGDSAGGTMAAAAAQKAAHEDGIKLCGQLLVYPCTDSSGEWPSFAAFANVPPFKALSK